MMVERLGFIVPALPIQQGRQCDHVRGNFNAVHAKQLLSNLDRSSCQRNTSGKTAARKFQSPEIVIERGDFEVLRSEDSLDD